MNYPTKYLPPFLKVSLEKICKQETISLADTVNILKTEKYQRYMEGKSYNAGLVLEVNLKEKTIESNWGSYGLNRNGLVRTGPVNTDKEERVLSINQVVAKLYLSRKNYMLSGDVLFHPKFFPNNIVEINLSDRERKIMFIFGYLNQGNKIKEFLARLSVNQSEIDVLLTKQALRKTRSGYAVTDSGRAAKSTLSLNDKW